MVDTFGRGRVFVAGGKETMSLSSSHALLNVRRCSAVCMLFPLCILRLTSFFSVHSINGGQGLNTSVQDAVSIFDGAICISDRVASIAQPDLENHFGL